MPTDEQAAGPPAAGRSATGPSATGPSATGRYRMLRRIAGGGMGEVYLAAASGPAGFSKLAVIKRILPHYAEDPDFVAMFVNEARLAAALDHPNIVRVYDFGEVQGGFFYAMEYLHGDSLAALLPRTATLPDRLPLAHAITIGLGMCAGLHFAHERRGPDGQPLGVVHRDVSPGNVFVTCEGEVKILDFGIAKAMATTGVTRDGVRKGKVPYMSPEQCIGAPLDRRSDVFAIGIVLYEMTTLSRLFRADNEFATMNMITVGDIPHPSTRVPGYPPALAEVVLKALRRDPADRHPSALELHLELDHVAHELGLRTSSLALGRYVRQLIDDRAYPSPLAASPDVIETRVFFEAMNDALTARDALPALPLPPALPPLPSPSSPALPLPPLHASSSALPLPPLHASSSALPLPPLHASSSALPLPPLHASSSALPLPPLPSASSPTQPLPPVPSAPPSPSRSPTQPLPPLVLPLLSSQPNMPIPPVVLPPPIVLPPTIPPRSQSSLPTPLPGSAPFEDTWVRTPPRRPRALVPMLAGGLAAAALILALVWPSRSPDPTPTAPAEPVIPIADAPTREPHPPPAPAAPPSAAPTPDSADEPLILDEDAADERAVDAEDPPVTPPRTRPAGERPRKKSSTAPTKKPNVLDSLRPSK